MAGWLCIGALAILLALIFTAYFYKINWVKDMRIEGSPKKILANYLGSRKRKLGKLPPVYPNGWFALIESYHIRKGEVKHVAALGENFAVFRTEKGVVNILDAYCPHLGANMAEGGHVRGDCLECPFHGWQFRGDNGQCQSIPYSEKIPHIARAKTWKSCEVNQIVFVWYHAEGMEPDWEPQANEFVARGSWRYQGRNEFLINCHIQEIAENGADFVHFSAVHGPAMFINKDVPWLARHSWTNASWSPCYSFYNSDSNEELINLQVSGNTEDPTEKLKHQASMTIKHSLALFERFSLLELDVRVKQIGPGYVELMIDTALGPMCIFQMVTPMEPLLQRVTHTIFSPPLLGPYATLVFLGECLMFERDVAIWDRKKFERQPTLVKEDRTILAYRRWYSQFYSQHSPNYQTAIKSLVW